jgi:hypothetical protein
MAQIFNEEEKEDLFDRGFNNEQIQFLESLEIEGIYFDICKLMDDYDDSPSKIIVDYQNANGIPVTGGKRKTRRNKRIRRTKKNSKSRRTKKNSKRGKSRRR